jgi:acetolactate synthase I/II/III large subunit
MNLTGADVIVQHLRANNVDTVFAITGAGNLAIIDAITRDQNIQLIFSHHEQSAVMEAQGYARISGKIGVALVTTGGGTSNVVTGVLSAHLDSIPVLIISGNESSFHCLNSSDLRAYGVQGFDSVAVLKPVTKYSVRIESSHSVNSIMQEAITTALDDRKGPAHVDVPMDIQRQACQVYNLARIEKVTSVKESDFDSVVDAIHLAKRPLFYFGNGCRDTISSALSLIKNLEIPYAVSWSALDLFDHQDPLNIGTIGIYGSHSANILLQKSDLLVCVGTRLAIPQVGYDKKDFGRSANKVIVDIDKSELNKFYGLGWLLINSSADEFIEGITSQLDKSAMNLSSWQSEIKAVKAALPLHEKVGPQPSSGYVHSADILQKLPDLLSNDAIIVTDVGAPLLNGHYIFKPKQDQRFFTSQGLGEMGFGLPGAIGAHFAEPNRQIVCLNTDGAIMFNLQELQVIKHHQIPLKLFIFNNGGYGMIKVSQDNLFEGRFAGSDTASGISFPNFADVANTFGFGYSKIVSLDNLIDKCDLLGDSSARIFDIWMDPAQKYFPRLATNKLPDGSFVSPPLEDLSPLLPIDLLERLLGYSPTNASFEARGIIRNGE